MRSSKHSVLQCQHSIQHLRVGRNASAMSSGVFDLAKEGKRFHSLGAGWAIWEGRLYFVDTARSGDV